MVLDTFVKFHVDCKVLINIIEIEELCDALAEEVDPSNDDVINAILHVVDSDKVGLDFVKTRLHAQTSPIALGLIYSHILYSNHGCTAINCRMGK